MYTYGTNRVVFFAPFSLCFSPNVLVQGNALPPKAAWGRALLPSCKEVRRFLPSDYQTAITILLLLCLSGTNAKTYPPRGAATGVTLGDRNPHRKEGLEVMISGARPGGEKLRFAAGGAGPKTPSSAPFSPRGSALGCVGEISPELSPRERNKGINHITKLHLLSSALLIS